MPSIGPLLPGTVEDNAGIGTLSWDTPSNAQAQDDVVTSAGNSAPLESGSGTTHYLVCRNFDFSAIPSNAIIVGVSGVKRQRRQNLDFGTVTDSVIQLWLSSLIGSNQSTGATWGTTLTDVEFGGSSDLMGASPSRSDVGSPDFGVAFAAFVEWVDDHSQLAEIDVVSLTIYYTEPNGVIVVTIGATTVQALAITNSTGLINASIGPVTCSATAENIALINAAVGNCVTGAVTCSGSATFAPGTKTAVGNCTTGATTCVGIAVTHKKVGVGSVTTGAATAAATGIYREFRATAAVTIGVTIVTSNAHLQYYIATGAAVVGAATASATGLNFPKRTAIGLPLVGAVTCSGVATMSDPVYTGASAVTIGAITGSALGHFAAAVHLGMLSVTTGAATIAGVASGTSPGYNATAAVTIGAAFITGIITEFATFRCYDPATAHLTGTANIVATIVGLGTMEPTITGTPGTNAWLPCS